MIKGGLYLYGGAKLWASLSLLDGWLNYCRKSSSISLPTNTHSCLAK